MINRYTSFVYRVSILFVGVFLGILSAPSLSHAAVPVNYQIFSNPFETTATITWTTDSLSTSTVNYGTTAGYGSASSSALLTTNHSITLTGLTASTTYHFQVGSGNSSGQTLSGDQTFNTVYSCTYYVDSVSGNNSNSGTTAEAPFQTLSTVPVVSNGSTICLRRGSTFYDSLYVGIPGNARNNITIQDYGPLNLAIPMIDNSATIAPTNWTSDGSGGYFTTAAVVGPGNSTSTPYGTFTDGSIWINVFECKSAPCVGPGLGGHDLNLSSQSSQANVDSTAGSYFIAGQTSGNPPSTPSSLTIYIHPSDGSNPSSNGYAYSYSARHTGIEITGANDTVSRIASKKSALNDGSIANESQSGGGGSSPTFNQVESDQGGKHNIICEFGCVINNSSFNDEYYTVGGNMIVVFENVSSGKDFTCNDCKLTQGVTTSGNAVTAFTSHVGSGSGLSNEFIGSSLIKALSSTVFGSFEADGQFSLFGGFTCDGVFRCIEAAATTTVMNSQHVSTSVGQAFIDISSPSVSTILTVGSSTACGTQQNGLIQNSSSGKGQVTVASSTFYQIGGQAAVNHFGLISPSSLTSSNNIFDAKGSAHGVYIPATTTVSYTGDNNSFVAPNDRFFLVGSNEYTNLLTGSSNWRSVSGQDLHSNTAAPTPFGNNTSTSTTACVIPAYAFSGPSSGSVGSASSNFAVTPNRTFTGSVTFWPTGSGSTGLGPTTLTWNGTSNAQTFSFIPQVAGSVTWTPTSFTASTSPAFEDPSALTFTASANVPGAPQGTPVAVAGDGQATVTFQGPASNGGANITSYTITSAPGSISTTTTTTSGVVTGLSDGTAYSFTVTATNSVGTGYASSASNQVTPAAPPSNNSNNSTPSGQSTSSTGGSSASVAANLQAIYAYNHMTCPALICTGAVTPAPAALNGVPAGTFMSDLQEGNSNNQVKSLQEFLNTHGYILTGSGPGSAGNETDLFGGLTKAALMRFQKDHGIPSTGFFGPITRAYIASH